jgi:hypothetical protein
MSAPRIGGLEKAKRTFSAKPNFFFLLKEIKVAQLCIEAQL